MSKIYFIAAHLSSLFKLGALGLGYRFTSDYLKAKAEADRLGCTVASAYLTCNNPAPFSEYSSWLESGRGGDITNYIRLAVKQLKQNGYDGVEYNDYYKEIIVFSPEQIQFIDDDVAKVVDQNCRCKRARESICVQDNNQDCPRFRRSRYIGLVDMSFYGHPLLYKPGMLEIKSALLSDIDSYLNRYNK